MNRVCAPVLVGMLAYSAAALPETYACAANPRIVAPCFDVRGRLSFWNGAPSARIWRIGATRMLGIHADLLPPDLAPTTIDFDTQIWGTFSVCPFTLQKPGHMQFVCIESWRDIAIRRRTDHASRRSSGARRAVVDE